MFSVKNKRFSKICAAYDVIFVQKVILPVSSLAMTSSSQDLISKIGRRSTKNLRAKSFQRLL